MGGVLFGGEAPRVRALPAGRPAVPLLADLLVRELPVDRDPFALADALILAPNRRAARALEASLAERLGAALLPRIQALGDVDTLAETWTPVGPDLPPAMDPMRRRLELAALIRARDIAEGGAADPKRAIAAADSLARLLDSEAAGDPVDWSRLPGLVVERDLAAHWRRSADFLAIIAEFWPARLAERNATDPAARRTAALRALAASWSARPPTTPVLIAGSTGSVAAARALMAVVARLPQGCVALPGLDLAMDETAWARLTPGHPQAGLKATLAAIDVSRHDVPPLAATSEGAARAVALREALAPAELTSDWLARLEAAGGSATLKEGLKGVRLIEAETPDEEARIAALALRRALESPGVRAALVTPDAELAARVSSKLSRWDLNVTPSAAQPLANRPIGALLFALLELALDDGAPVPLATLLRSPLARFAEASAPLLAPGGFGLRGPRRWRDLADLAASVGHGGRTVLAEVAAALAPLREAFAAEAVSLAVAVAALARAAEACCASPWDDPAGEAAVGALETIRDHGDGLGLLAPQEAQRALQRLLAEIEAPSGAESHPRLAIWGPLEARMQHVDMVVLAGLNEGVWPAHPPEDPFLTRGMRVALGLPDPETRLGLAAHDFAQLASSPEVLLLRSKRDASGPTVASRWLWRLKTLAAGAGALEALTAPSAEDLRAIAYALDAPAAITPARAPQPRPAAELRPRQIAVTDVETLIRDPYAFYAKRVLGLRVADGFGREAGPRERGSAVHAALDAFRAGDDESAEALAELLRQALEEQGFAPERLANEAARLGRACEAFARWATDARTRGWTSRREVNGKLDLPGFTITARADSIEIGPNGALAVLDVKTGAEPTTRQACVGLWPQLPLEAAILAAGGFEHIPAGRAQQLVLWRFVARKSGPDIVPQQDSAVPETALDKLCDLMARYGADAQPFLSKPRAKFAQQRADFDHLARRAEWADVEGDDE